MKIINMASVVHKILHFYELLPEVEKKQVAFEIIRRSLKFDLPLLTEDEFTHTAEELFLELDRREAQNA